MTKVNKTTIIRELKKLKEEQIQAKWESNRTKQKQFKEGLIDKYSDRLESLSSKLSPILNEYLELVRDLSKDSDIGLYTYYSNNSLLGNLGTVNEAKRYIMDNASFYRGSYSVYENQLREDVFELEQEWDKLLVYAKSLKVKDLRKFLEDNNIELECIKNEGKVVETALVVQDINFNKLWSVDNVK